jgi:hypothetical protein
MSISITTPSQTQFIEHGLVAAQAPNQTTCSVCVELCLEGEDVVNLVPCANCYFHRECIVSWFTSSSSKRGTCPNDRVVLFMPDRIAAGADIETEVSEEDIRRLIQEAVELTRKESRIVGNDNIIRWWISDDQVDRVRDIQDLLAFAGMRLASLPSSERDELTPLIIDTEIAVRRQIDRYTSAIFCVLSERVDALRGRLIVGYARRGGSRWREYIESELENLLEGSRNPDWSRLAVLLQEADHIEQCVAVYEGPLDRFAVVEDNAHYSYFISSIASEYRYGSSRLLSDMRPQFVLERIEQALQEVAVFVRAETELEHAARTNNAWCNFFRAAFLCRVFCALTLARNRLVYLPSTVRVNAAQRLDNAEDSVQQYVDRYRGAVEEVIVERVSALRSRMNEMRSQTLYNSAMWQVSFDRTEKDLEKILEEVNHSHCSIIVGLFPRVDFIERIIASNDRYL